MTLSRILLALLIVNLALWGWVATGHASDKRDRQAVRTSIQQFGPAYFYWVHCHRHQCHARWEWTAAAGMWTCRGGGRVRQWATVTHRERCWTP